jgi:diadenosine tetraphosphate (Ap4A) HIT family hydrolase
MCSDGRPDVDANGNRRFFAGTVADGYLQRNAPAPGYTVVVWRGPHVADVSEMSEPDLFAYWGEVVQVARALTYAFEPCHLNCKRLHTFLTP